MTLSKLLVVAMACAACACSTSAPVPEGNPVSPWSVDVLHEVVIRMDPDDWNALRLQGYSDSEQVKVLSVHEAVPSPYTWFGADVTIDGNELRFVGIRKKGFAGSASTEKPSLRLRFDRFARWRRYHGLSRLVLNNCLQSADCASQCACYDAYERMGVPAPRCSIAVVEINGRRLGQYAMVESIDSDFLERWFGNSSGELYEGMNGDLQAGFLEGLWRKPADRFRPGPALVKLAEAASDRDSSFVRELSRVLDVERFMRYWATTMVLALDDSYPVNRSNFFLYHSPATGRFVFVPWGADECCGSTGFGLFHGRALLVRRFLSKPATRRRFEQVVEDAASALLDGSLERRWRRLLRKAQEAVTEGERENFLRASGSVSRFLSLRRDAVEELLAGSGSDAGAVRSERPEVFFAPFRRGEPPETICTAIRSTGELDLSSGSIVLNGSELRARIERAKDGWRLCVTLVEPASRPMRIVRFRPAGARRTIELLRAHLLRDPFPRSGPGK